MSRKEYSMIYGILVMLGNSYIDKLPKNIFENIKNNLDIDFIPSYDINEMDSYEFTDNVLEVINNFEQEYWN